MNIEDNVVIKPWGYYKVLIDTPNYKVKFIEINSKSRLSLQSHEKRREHWFVVSGGALTVEVGEDRNSLSKHQLVTDSNFNYFDIEMNQLHRASNETEEPVQFIEIQTGDYFGEDDIIRYQDDYGRS